MTPLHVCDLTMLYASHSGGVRRYLGEKRRWLRTQQQFRHTLVLPRYAQGPSPRQADGLIEVPSLPLPFSRGYRMPLNTRAAFGALKTLRPHLIEAADPYHFAWAAVDAGQALGVPVIGFCHSDLPRMLGRLAGARVERAAEAYVRRLYARFDLVLAPSRCMTERLGGMGVQHVQHQPLGVDSRAFHPCRAHQGLRRALGLAEDDRLLVYFGRFGPEKNLPVLYRMLDLLGDGHVLLLIGDGTPPHHRAVRALPFQSDPRKLAALVAACDVFVHAGDQETFGLATLEAMACGVPAVVAGTGGQAELVDDAVGARTDAGSPQRGTERFAAAMADGVRAVLARDRVALGKAARLRAERHDWCYVLPTLGRTYYAACRGADPHA